MPGLVPGIHVLLRLDKKDVDGRHSRLKDGVASARLWPGRDEMSHKSQTR